MNSRNMWFSKGRCLITKNNEYMLVIDRSPYQMLTQNKQMFKGLENGDEIFVFHDGMQESYPGSTGVYFVIKTTDGDITDIPYDTLVELTQMGWIEESILPEDLDMSQYTDLFLEEEMEKKSVLLFQKE